MKTLSSLALILIPTLASASDCPAWIKPTWDGHPSCQCGNILRNIAIAAPDEFRLVGVCGLKRIDASGDAYPVDLRKQPLKSSHDFVGEFFFEGDASLAGTVAKGPDSDAGDLFFYPDTPSPSNKSKFSREIRSLRFEDYERANSLLKTPSLSSWSDCWSSESTIRIRRIRIEYGWGTDSEGAYASSYMPVTLGSYRKCKSGAN